jgi:hypothetical protein
MKTSKHKNTRVFARYNVTSDEDLNQGAEKLNQYIQNKKLESAVTITVTKSELSNTRYQDGGITP